MRRIKEEADQTRQQLLDTALRVFSRDGYMAARLEDISAEAGVTRGAIYHHFGSKHGLYMALVDEYSQDTQRILAEAAEAGGSPLTVLRRSMLELTLAGTRDQRTRDILRMIIYKTGTAPDLARDMDAKVDGTLKLIDHLAELLRAGMAAGEVDPATDAHDAAVALLALQNGLVMLWLLDARTVDLSGHAAAIFDLFIHRIAPTG